MNGLADKLWIILKSELLTALRYRGGFIAALLAMVGQIATAFYLARAVGGGFQPDGVAYFPFLLVGAAVTQFLLAGITSFVNTIHQAQLTGTMEVLMTTRTPPAVIMFLTAASSFSGQLLIMLGYVASGLLLFRVSLGNPNLLACGIVLGLALVVAVAIGIMAAAVQVAFHKGSALVWLVGSSTWLLSGVVFPVNALPEPLQWLSRALPLTYVLDAARAALFRDATLRMVTQPLLALAAFAALLLPVSLLSFSRALRGARLRGTLSFY